MIDDVAGVDPGSDEEPRLPDELPASEKNTWGYASEDEKAANADKPEDVESDGAEAEARSREETTEPDEGGDGAGDEEQDGVSDKARPKRNRPGKTQRTIGRLEGQVSALTEAVQQLAGHSVRGTERGRESIGGPTRTPTREPVSEPGRGDYAKYEDYLAALTAFNARKAVHEEVDAASRRYAASARQRKQVEQTETLYDEGVKKYPDFVEVVGRPSLEISHGMVEAMYGTVNPTDVVYHLGTHPQEAERISRLTPLAAATEIGRISASLAASGDAAKSNSAGPSFRKSTELPDPPNTIHGGGAPTKDPVKMTNAEYRAWRMRSGQT